MTGLLIMRLAAFAMSVVVARVTGVETFGEFTLFVTIFMLVSETPHAFDTAYLRATGVENDVKSRELYESANIAIKFALTTILGAIFFIFSGLISELFGSPASGRIVLWAIVCGGLNSIYMIMPAKAQQQRDSRGVALLKPIFNLSVLAVTMTGLLFDADIDIEFILRVYLIAGVVLSLWAISRTLVISNLCRGNYSRIRSYIVVSLTLLMSIAFNLVGNRLDVFFLGHYLDFEQLGVYGVALRMAIVLSVITGVIGTILIPRAAEAASDLRKFKRYLALSCFYVVVQLIGAVVLLLILEPIIATIFGIEYMSAVVPASILICHVLVTSIGVPFQALIQCGDRPGRLIYITLVKIMVSVTLLLYLVPQYGVIGAAGAILISTSVMTLWVLANALRDRPREVLAAN